MENYNYPFHYSFTPFNMYSRRGPVVEYPSTQRKRKFERGEEEEEERETYNKPIPLSMRTNILHLEKNDKSNLQLDSKSTEEEKIFLPKAEKEEHEHSEDECFTIKETKGVSREITPPNPSIPGPLTTKSTKNLSDTVEDFLFFANTMLQESERQISTESSPSPSSPISVSSPVSFSESTTPEESMTSYSLPRRGTSKLLREFLDALIQHECAWPFLLPVDLKEAPDYYGIVTNPMDFTTLQKKIDEGVYENSVEKFGDDVRLIFDNCLLYNEANSQYSGMALALSTIFENRFKAFCEQVIRLSNTRSVSPRSPLARSSRVITMWTESEDSRLKKLIDKYGEDWNRIAKYFPQKAPDMCQERSESAEFQSQDTVPRLRRNWSKEEDDALRKIGTKYGTENWELIASQMPSNAKRSAAGCKNRWNVLESKKLDRNWTEEEEKILQDCWKKYGHQWSKYHKYLPTKPYFTIRKRALEIYEPSLA